MVTEWRSGENRSTRGLLLYSVPSHAVALAPGEPRDGVAERRVFAADPAGIAELVDAAEYILPADLAGAGLVPAGHVGELHMLDRGQQLFEAGGHVALGGLAVIEVELQADAVAPDRRDHGGALLLRAQQVTRRVARVERLDRQHDAGLLRPLGGPGEVDRVKRQRGVVGQIRRRHPGHDMQQLAIERRRVIESLLDTVAEDPGLARQAREAALAFAPVPGRAVEQHQADPCRG